MKSTVFLMGLLLFSVGAFSQGAFKVASHNARVNLTVNVTKEGKLLYALNLAHTSVVKPSSLGFKLQKPAISLTNFTLISADSSEFSETWNPVWGEVKSIENHYKQLKLRLKAIPANVLIDVVFRVFNDGIGFRYEFPEQEGFKHFIVADELTQFNLSTNNKTFWIPGDYDTNEYLYNTTLFSEIHALAAAKKEKDIALQSLIADNAIQTPLMMKTPQGIYLNIHEAALVNYPVMHLMANTKTFGLTSHLTPDAVGNKAYLQTPFNTPWRTIVLSNKAEDILASKLILNLNEPSKIEKTDWIKPQKFIGMWWEMHVGKATWEKVGGKHGANTENVKKYIDFASENGFDGVLVEGWNEGWEDWFGNWKEEVFDFVTPYSDYDVDALLAYAKKKNVKLIMHHETSGSVTNYERRMDKAFQFMKNKGFETAKTGYVGRIIPRGEHHDSQWMVNHFNRVAAKAAEYNIMIEAHESSRPTGLHRTYPNWLANEAARGNEFNNAPTLGLVPEHETILPFTRLMGGPMDYTPGFFKMHLNQFIPSRTTRVRTTLAKQLALYVTMYSPLQMVGDLPENLKVYPDALQFIKDVPVDWDDTKILSAEPGEFIMIARKQKGQNQWFVGAVSDENSRELLVNFDFLPTGKTYTATIYQDASNADWEKNPEAYQIQKISVDSQTKRTIKIAKGGGFAISIK